MSMNPESQYRIQELHHPQLQRLQGDCSVVLYDDKTPLNQGAARGRAQGDKAVLLKMTGSGCHEGGCENPGLSTRISTSTGPAMTVAEKIAWFEFRHNQVNEEIRRPEAQGIRELGEVLLEATFAQMEAGCDLESARNEVARAFLLGKVPLPSSAAAEVMAAEPGLALDVVQQQSPVL